MQLGTQLCASFLRITQGLDVEVDDADEALLDEQCNKTMSAIGIMKTISTLIVSLDSSAQVMCQLEEVIMPILVETLGKSLLDLYDDAFEIVCSFTYCAKVRVVHLCVCFDCGVGCVPKHVEAAAPDLPCVQD